MKYSAAVTQYVIIDDIAEDREWSGTITASDGLTFQFRQNDYGIYSDDAADHPPHRLRLFTPDRKLVAWSDSKDADAIRAAVEKAIVEVHNLCKPVYEREGEVTETITMEIRPDSVLYHDRYANVSFSYSRRSDGSVDIESRQPFKAGTEAEAVNK